MGYFGTLWLVVLTKVLLYHEMLIPDTCYKWGIILYCMYGCMTFSYSGGHGILCWGPWKSRKSQGILSIGICANLGSPWSQSCRLSWRLCPSFYCAWKTFCRGISFVRAGLRFVDTFTGTSFPIVSSLYWVTAVCLTFSIQVGHVYTVQCKPCKGHCKKNLISWSLI